MNVDFVEEIPLADKMPYDRWWAYMVSTALSKGYHGRFSIGTLEGKSKITVYKKETK
jgi:hypothetical protein